MTMTLLVIVLVVAWVAIGVAVGISMGRRGHHAVLWTVLGVVFGPFSIRLAWRAVRDEPTVTAHELSPGREGGGTVDVLVGIDGSDRSEAALRAVTRLLGDRIGRLTLASVIDYESVGSSRPVDTVWDDEIQAVELLERLRGTVESTDPGTAVLAGSPPAALTKEAVDGGYAVLVVGRRGRGASKALLGSTASQLSRSEGVPVLIV